MASCCRFCASRSSSKRMPTASCCWFMASCCRFCASRSSRKRMPTASLLLGSIGIPQLPHEDAQRANLLAQ